MSGTKSKVSSGNICSFCGKKEQDVLMLISGRTAHICDECCTHAHHLIEQELGFTNESYSIAKPSKTNKKNKEKSFSFNPRQIKDYLDQYVIGQDEAKKVVSVAVYNHYKRIDQEKKDEIEIEKSNIIISGETGTGKTLIARTIAKLLDVPFAIVDATVFTEAGYVGEDIESMLTRLLQACEYDVQQAQRGIVYIDEIDKLARRGDNPSITKDVGGEGVQQGLLKMLEGTDVLVPPQGGRKHPDQQMVKIDTRNILFICGGAFSGIDKIISRRMNTAVIGFNDQNQRIQVRENILDYITHNDLKNFGLIPELLGRMPVLCSLKPLDKETLKLVLLQPKNALLKQYKKIFELENIDLQIEDDVLDKIVDIAWDYKLGARGLRSICEMLLTDAMFDFKGKSETKKQFVIDLNYANTKLNSDKLLMMKVA